MKIIDVGRTAAILNMIIKKVIEWLRNSLSKKMIIVFSTISTLLVLSLIYVSYCQTTRLLKEDFIFSNNNNLKMAVRNFESYIDGINDISILLSKDSQFMSDLSVQDDSFVSETYRQNQMRNLFYSRKDFEKVSLFLPWNSKEYSITKASGQVYTDTNDKLFKQAWTKHLDQEKVKNRYLEPYYEMEDNALSGVSNSVFLSYHRKFINIQNSYTLGILTININHTELNKMLDDVDSRYNEVMGIYDNKDKLIFTSDEKRKSILLDKTVLKNTDNGLKGGDFTATINNDKYIGIYSVSENEGWKIIKLIPTKTINEAVQESSGLSILIGIIFICLFFVITIVISNTITSPLRKLTKKMMEASTGNFESTIERIRGNDEIARLSKTFNKMLADINELIDEKYKAKLGERNARLKVLESQINPHFMYNTLQAISTEALESDASNVSTMIEALAKILRYCFSESDKVTLLKEMEYVNRYFLLIKARFCSRLNVRIHVEKAAECIVIPKLSIQTIVENAIKHVLEKTSDQILLSIEVHKSGGTVVIKVSDNGPGIDSEKLEEILKGFEEDTKYDNIGVHSGMGLRNLYARLKIMYGGKASMKIDTVLNQGTAISIIIPVEDRMEERQDV